MVLFLPLSNFVANPKSAILRFSLLIKIFEGLRSRWITSESWMCFIPFKIFLKYLLVFCSLKYFSFITKSAKVFLLQSSKIRYTYYESSKILYSFKIYLLFNCEWISISLLSCEPRLCLLINSLEIILIPTNSLFKRFLHS